MELTLRSLKVDALMTSPGALMHCPSVCFSSENLEFLCEERAAVIGGGHLVLARCPKTLVKASNQVTYTKNVIDIVIKGR